MSRCKSCNNALSDHETPRYNKIIKEEEFLCHMCLYLCKHSAPEREYVGGRFPVDGATAMKSSSSD